MTTERGRELRRIELNNAAIEVCEALDVDPAGLSEGQRDALVLVLAEFRRQVRRRWDLRERHLRVVGIRGLTSEYPFKSPETRRGTGVIVEKQERPPMVLDEPGKDEGKPHTAGVTIEDDPRYQAGTWIGRDAGWY